MGKEERKKERAIEKKEKRNECTICSYLFVDIVLIFPAHNVSLPAPKMIFIEVVTAKPNWLTTA